MLNPIRTPTMTAGAAADHRDRDLRLQPDAEDRQHDGEQDDPRDREHPRHDRVEHRAEEARAREDHADRDGEHQRDREPERHGEQRVRQRRADPAVGEAVRERRDRRGDARNEIGPRGRDLPAGDDEHDHRGPAGREHERGAPAREPPGRSEMGRGVGLHR
jgi:hypothetical protein